MLIDDDRTLYMELPYRIITETDPKVIETMATKGTTYTKYWIMSNSRLPNEFLIRFLTDEADLIRLQAQRELARRNNENT